MIRTSALKPLAFACLLAGAARAEDSTWVSLLNGKDLRDWTPYFQKTGIGNPDSTYRVSPEGYLDINIHISFNTTGFGHLFYTKRKFSFYMVRAQYRFQTATYGPDWGQGWNMQNNGLMLHSQDPKTMKGKDFPTSIEVQLLGPKNGAEPASADWPSGHTANLCTPSTFVAYNGNADYTQHCTASQYPDAWKKKTIPFEDPAGWTDVTVRVLSDSLVQHFIHGAKVFEYTRLREDNGTPLKDGYLSVQAEGTSTQFKELSILDLEGCMDKSKPAYRSFFVKSNPADCNTPTAIAPGEAEVFSLAREGRSFVLRGGAFLWIRGADGARVPVAAGGREFAPPRPGVYFAAIITAAGIRMRKLAWF